MFNEKPAEEEIIEADAAAAVVLPAAATLHTTLGDIVIKLQGEHCPRTVENFSTHAKKGYYDSILFHRIIKNFMIQTGVRTRLIAKQLRPSGNQLDEDSGTAVIMVCR